MKVPGHHAQDFHCMFKGRIESSRAKPRPRVHFRTLTLAACGGQTEEATEFKGDDDNLDEK